MKINKIWINPLRCCIENITLASSVRKFAKNGQRAHSLQALFCVPQGYRYLINQQMPVQQCQPSFFFKDMKIPSELIEMDLPGTIQTNTDLKLYTMISSEMNLTRKALTSAINVAEPYYRWVRMSADRLRECQEKQSCRFTTFL